MTQTRLIVLLQELADGQDVASVPAGPQPMASPAVRAWRRAAQLRRRRRALRVGAAAAVVAVVATVPFVVAARGPDGSTASSTPSSSAGPSAGPSAGSATGTPSVLGVRLPVSRFADGLVVQQAPLPGQVARFPVLPSMFRALDAVPRSAVPLSSHPVDRIVAAAQASPDSPVLVLGADGGWRQVDYPLVPVTDPVNGTRPELTDTAISPDATRITLLQPGRVVVVDASGGSAVTVPVAGIPESVHWLPDGRIAVSGNRGTVLADPAAVATTAAAGYPAADLISGTGSVLTWPGGVVLPAEVDAGGSWGSAWASPSGRLARTVSFGQALGSDQGPVVVDPATGVVTALRFGWGDGSGDPATSRVKGCCATLGWLAKGTLLVRDGATILAWDVDQATAYRVAVLAGPAVTVALAPGSGRSPR